MTDYDYDQHRATISGSDRSQNSAAALAGYPLDVRPDGSWPGLHADPSQQRFDKTAMNDVVETIRNLIADAGAIKLTSAASVSFGPETWQAAVYLKHASGQVAQAVQDYSQRLIQNLQQAADAISKAAGNYGDAETTNTGNVDAVNNNMPAGQNPPPW